MSDIEIDLDYKLKSALRLQEEKKYKAALKTYKQILKIDRNQFDAWLNAGILYSKLEESEKAVNSYSRAIKIKQNREIYYNLGVEYFKVGKYALALDMMQKCIQEVPHDSAAYLMSALISDRLSDFETAQLSIENLLKVEPQHKGAHAAMIMLYLKLGQHEKAMEYLEKLISLGEKKEFINKLRSRILLNKGDIHASIDVFKTMVKENSELKDLKKSFKEEIPVEKKELIQQKKDELEAQDKKENQEWLDLSLLSLFEGDSDQALDYLQHAAKKTNLT